MAYWKSGGRGGRLLSSAVGLMACACGFVGVDLDDDSSVEVDDESRGDGDGDGDGDLGDGDGDVGDGDGDVGDGDGDVGDGDGDLGDGDGDGMAGGTGDPPGEEGDVCELAEQCLNVAPICTRWGMCQDGGGGDKCYDSSECDQLRQFACVFPVDAPLGSSGTCQREAGTGISTLVDDFLGDAISQLWHSQTNSNGCVMTLEESYLTFSVEGEPSNCSLLSSSLYDLRGDAAYLNISPFEGLPESIRFSFGIRGLSGDVIEIRYQGGNLNGWVTAGGIVTFAESVPYEAQEYVRIRQTEDQIYLETSAVGLVWEVEMQFPVPFDTSRVGVVLEILNDGVLEEGRKVTVDGINTLLPVAID